MNGKPTIEELRQRVRALEREASALRQAEADSRLVRDRFERMLAAIGDGVDITTYDYRVVYANDNLKRITGKNELEGDLCYRAFLDRDAPCEKCPMRRAIASERTETQRISLPNGRVVELTASPLRLPSGEMAAIEIARDITGPREAEARRRESEETFEAIFERATDGILLADLETRRFVAGNAMICQMLGYGPREITDLAVRDIHPPEDLPWVLEQIGKQARGEITLAPEIPVKRKDGSVFFADINSSPISFSGRPCIMGIFRDITERKKMEKERLRAQKLESVGVLAGGIAHDFNNLLTGVMGSISLAKLYAKQGDRVFATLLSAEKACLQAKDLSQQLLTFSKGGKPVRKATSIAELIRDSAGFGSRGSDVRCALSIGDDLWVVEVDEGQIAQVMNNLVINACQAMPSGGLIQVKAENMTAHDRPDVPLPDGEYVHIMVEDHGPGIPSEHLPQIFDPYFTTKQSGSGLGLATVYSIIKNHDGYVSADSQLGVGTAFHVYLPASSQTVLPKPAPEAGLAETLLTKGRILVLDDQAIVRETAGEMLAFIGFEAEYASEGAEAVELYRRAKEAGQPFDAVIMDLTIPGGMGGKETFRRLCEIDPQVTAVVSSGYSNDPIMSSFREYGFKGVLAKPYRTEELSRVLRDAIDSC